VVDRLTHSRSRGFGFITFDAVEVKVLAGRMRQLVLCRFVLVGLHAKVLRAEPVPRNRFRGLAALEFELSSTLYALESVAPVTHLQ
jgi:hypothetical protein